MNNRVWASVTLIVSCFTIARPVAYAELPTVNVVEPNAATRAGEPATLLYRLSWDGDPGDWRIPPPELKSPDWGSAEIRSAKTLQIADTTIVEFDVAVIAAEPGVFEFPAQKFAVYRASELTANDAAPLKEAPPAWSTSDSVTADTATITVSADYSFLILGGALGAATGIGVLLAFAFTVRSKSRRGPAAAAGTTIDPRDYIHAARKQRLDGDFYAFYGALERAAGAIGGPDATQLAARFKERGREVGYSGLRPTDDELDAALKEMERALTANRR